MRQIHHAPRSAWIAPLRGLVLAGVWGGALAHASLATCTLDARDPFEPHAAMPRGPFAGKCLDTSEQRSIRILSPESAARYRLTVDRERMVVANVRHAGRYWVTEVRPDAIEDVILMIEYFPAVVPAAHTQLRFRFRDGLGPRLVPQVGSTHSVPIRLTDLVYSVEAMSPVHGEAYDLVKGTQNHYATAFRFVSLEDRYRHMVTLDHHRVEQVRLNLTPDEERRVLVRSLRDSDAAQLDRMYHTLTLNCTTELLRAVDRSVSYDGRHRALAGATFFLDGIPTQCKNAFGLRGLLASRDRGRLPDLDKERNRPAGVSSSVTR